MWSLGMTGRSARRSVSIAPAICERNAATLDHAPTWRPGRAERLEAKADSDSGAVGKHDRSHRGDLGLVRRRQVQAHDHCVDDVERVKRKRADHEAATDIPARVQAAPRLTQLQLSLRQF